jgi:SHS2 domain-containing protein
MSASHRFDDHTAEVELTIESDSLDELFAEAARALATLLLGQPPPPPPSGAPRVPVTVRAPDLNALLIEWLNELIYRTETEATVFTDALVQKVNNQEIAAQLRGLRAPELATEVKAATLHDAYVRRYGDGYRGHAILDV